MEISQLLNLIHVCKAYSIFERPFKLRQWNQMLFVVAHPLMDPQFPSLRRHRKLYLCFLLFTTFGAWAAWTFCLKSFVLHRRMKVKQDWNNIRVNKWRQSCILMGTICTYNFINQSLWEACSSLLMFRLLFNLLRLTVGSETLLKHLPWQSTRVASCWAIYVIAVSLYM